MAAADLTADTLRALLDYDQDTGRFIRRTTTNGPWKAGTATGAKADSGYVRVYVGGAYYVAHRLAWLHVYGEWPDCILDHINGDRSDNRLCNLRPASTKINAQNLHRARSDSLTGFLGVSRTRKGNFSATIKTELAGCKLQLYLGSYSTPEAAYAVYIAAKRKLHEGCTI